MLTPPTKKCFEFAGFTPSLPKIFLLDEDKKEYVAQWGKVLTISIIEGDERLEVKEREVSFPIEKVRTFGDVKAKLAKKISLKPAWMSGDYGIYDFRRENYEGEEIKDDSPVEDGMKVYPRSNYIKFEWSKEAILVNYTGEKPRGKIIIPTKTTGISDIRTEEYDRIGLFLYCSELVSVDFTGCKNLESISEHAFNYCPKLESLNFTGCSKLKEFRFYNDANTGLKSLNLKGCTELTKVKCSLRMSFESLDLSLCAKLEELYLSRGYRDGGTINLTGCNNLIYINIEDAGIRSIDLSPCPKLSTVVFRRCRNINSVNLTGCTELTHIMFCEGCDMTSIDLSQHKKLNKFHVCESNSLKNVDLSGCTAIEALGGFDSTINCCKNAEVKLGKNIKGIREDAFGKSYDYICKKVLVPNETIKQLVKDSNYPEDRIEMYH
jgi:surface protein, putative